MTKKEMRRAAKVLRREARILRTSNIDNRGNWACSVGTIAEHAEMIELAHELEQHAKTIGATMRTPL